MGAVIIREGCVFDANEARVGGGGALSVMGNVSLTIKDGVRFSRNSAARQGGAVSVHSASDIRVNDALFIENTSHFTGGGAMFVEVRSSLSVQIRRSWL